MKLRHVLLIGLLTGVAWAGWSFVSRSPTPDPPVIDVRHLHPLVAKAITSAIESVRQQPRSAESWGGLGIVLIAHDLPPQARECLAHAEAFAPTDFQWPYFIGYSLIQTDMEAALKHFERALKLKPDYRPLRIRIAQILMRLGELDRCQTVLDGDPNGSDDPYLLMTRGRLAELKNEPKLAEECFITAANLTDWMPHSAYLELVRLASRRGDHELAYQHQRKLVVLPDVAKMEFPDPVLEEIRRFEGLSKKLAERADIALARGDFTSAIIAFQSFLHKRPDMPTAHENLAQAYAMSGRYAEAVAAYQTVLNTFGESVGAHMGLARTYERAGQTQPAVDHYRSVLRIKPNHKQAWFFVGMLYEQQGHHDEAIEAYQKSVVIDPGYAQAQLALGVALLKQNRAVEARPHVARAVALVPNDPIPLGYLKQVDEQIQNNAKKSGD